MEAAGARPDQIEGKGLDEGNPAGIDSRDQADQEPGDAQRRQVAGGEWSSIAERAAPFPR